MEGYISKGSARLLRRSSSRSDTRDTRYNTNDSTVRRSKSPLKAILNSLHYGAFLQDIA